MKKLISLMLILSFSLSSAHAYDEELMRKQNAVLVEQQARVDSEIAELTKLESLLIKFEKSLADSRFIEGREPIGAISLTGGLLTFVIGGISISDAYNKPGRKNPGKVTLIVAGISIALLIVEASGVYHAIASEADVVELRLKVNLKKSSLKFEKKVFEKLQQEQGFDKE